MRSVEGSPEVGAATIGGIFREESGRCVATLIRVYGDIDVAEDAVQDAFAVALRKWPIDGLPPNPGGWIMTTARRYAIDRLRRETRGRDLVDEVAVLSSRMEDPGIPEMVAHTRRMARRGPAGLGSSAAVTRLCKAWARVGRDLGGHPGTGRGGGGTAPGARAIPLGSLAGHAETLARDARVIVTCGVGERATSAASVLERAGFTSLASLAGGMDAWRNAGLTMVRT